MATTIPGVPPEHSVEGEAAGRDHPARAATSGVNAKTLSSFGIRQPHAIRRRPRESGDPVSWLSSRVWTKQRRWVPAFAGTTVVRKSCDSETTY